MKRLVMIGVNHTTAPLELREKLAFSPAARAAAVEKFRAVFDGSELVILSTCNRVELYAARSGSHLPPTEEDLAAFLAGFQGMETAALRDHLYVRSDREVIHHLFHVSGSLDSMVLGETQILGQVRESYEAARTLGGTGSLLNPLFQRAMAVGKQIMRETTLNEGRLSIASVAVEYAGQIFDTLTDKTVLCIGAGKMTALVLRHFAALSPLRMIVCNRDPQKAAMLARRFDASASSLAELEDHLVAADVVISSTGASEPIIRAAEFEGIIKRRRYRPVFVIDIAMPRDVEPAVGKLENTYLYNLDDLQQVVAATQSQRKGAIEQAEAIIRSAVEDFASAHRTRELGPVIAQLQARYLEVARDELLRALAKMPNLSDDERAAVEEMSRRIVNKLLHDPMRALRNGEGGQIEASTYLSALQKLFKLEAQATVGRVEAVSGVVK